MKIHSDKITREDLRKASNWAGAGIVCDAVDRGSKSRARSFVFRLSKPGAYGGRQRNSGTHGAEGVPAASWDEHGYFFAYLFGIDPKAIIGPYDGFEDFHRQTKAKYRYPEPTTVRYPTMPEDFDASSIEADPMAAQRKGT